MSNKYAETNVLVRVRGGIVENVRLARRNFVAADWDESEQVEQLTEVYDTEKEAAARVANFKVGDRYG